MEIIIADEAGVCFGVKRATEIAFEAADEAEKPVLTFGELIHNPQVVEKLRAAGVAPAGTSGEITGATVIIRSHGLPPDTFREVEARAARIIDATCPIVKAQQHDAEFLAGEGYRVVIIGDRNHPEVIAVAGYAGSDAVIIDSVDEAERMERHGKVGVVIQTTHRLDECEKIIGALLPKARELRVFNTLCNATSVRQDAARELAGQVDVMLIVGGRNSANTARLAEICAEVSDRSYHIETADEIDPKWFDGAERVGITGGASTPDWIIEGVVARLIEFEDATVVDRRNS
jgi:(E)-4-hydroxy-3-methyl-but-2-enyl pyrophosphate reductase